jgi:ribosomal protein L37AE/L43A
MMGDDWEYGRVVLDRRPPCPECRSALVIEVRNHMLPQWHCLSCGTRFDARRKPLPLREWTQRVRQRVAGGR